MSNRNVATSAPPQRRVAVVGAGLGGLAATPRLRPQASKRRSSRPGTLLRFRAECSVSAAVSRFVHNERPRQLSSCHSLLVGGDFFETCSSYALIHCLEQNEACSSCAAAPARW